MRERSAYVLVSLAGDHHHGVEAPCERHLGQREEEGSEARLDLLAVLSGEAGQAVQEQHPNLSQETEVGKGSLYFPQQKSVFFGLFLYFLGLFII